MGYINASAPAARCCNCSDFSLYPCLPKPYPESSVIRVHDENSGAYLGTIKPSLYAFRFGGRQLSITHGMTAHLRSNGKLALFTGEVGRDHPLRRMVPIRSVWIARSRKCFFGWTNHKLKRGPCPVRTDTICKSRSDIPLTLPFLP